jgi:hypothetical protein
MLGREPEPDKANEEPPGEKARLMQVLRDAPAKAIEKVQSQIDSKKQEIERQSRLMAELRSSMVQESVGAASTVTMNRVWRVLDAAIADGRARPIK